MKKSSFLLLLLMFLVTIVVLYLNSFSLINNKNQPVRENTSGYLKFPKVGDLYIIKNNETGLKTFFKIAGSPNQAQVYILKGYNTATLPGEKSYKGLFRLMSFYDNYISEMATISKKELLALNNHPYKTLKIYRQSQQLFLSFTGIYYNSPLGFFGTLLGIIILLWGLKSTFLVANHRLKLLENPNIIYLSTAITTFLFTYFFATGQTFLFSWGYILIFYVLSIIPVTFVFHYANDRFFSKLDFFDREVNKFFCIFIIGFLFQLWAYSGMIALYKALDIVFLGNFYNHELLGLPSAFVTSFLSWLGIASLNFLYNFNTHYFNFQQKVKELNQAKMNELQSQAELDALHARVNPHFLYNSLNSIAGLAQEDPIKTEEMAIALSHFYKYSTNRQMENWCSMEEEMEILDTYLNIEKIRFGKRLQYVINCPASIKLEKIPRFLLQPLVENAIKYGYQSTTNSIDIEVNISQEVDGSLLLQVFDGGQPFPDNLPSGYGLQSIRKKLDLLLPESYELAFINAPKKHVAITLY